MCWSEGLGEGRGQRSRQGTEQMRWIEGGNEECAALERVLDQESGDLASNAASATP